MVEYPAHLHAGLVQWQYATFPRWRREFDSRIPLNTVLIQLINFYLRKYTTDFQVISSNEEYLEILRYHLKN